VTSAPACHRGLLVSVEGLNGVGKTHLTDRLVQRWPASGLQRPVVIEEFSQRAQSGPGDLGRDLLQALKRAAAGDAFLRGGHPMTETLLLLAIKLHDYEASRPSLHRGRLVLEGRGLHSVAVYQSLILHPEDDGEAWRQSRDILDLAAGWRPLPDLTILVTDEVDTALGRAERRDRHPYTPEERRIHLRAATLFERLAAADPERVVLLDRRTTDSQDAVDRMEEWIRRRQTGVTCAKEPGSPGAAGEPCARTCRLAISALATATGSAGAG